jgi:hypothetical protein
MQLNISIGYSDLFKGEKPSLSELLSELPSELIISMLAKLNAEIYFNSNEFATQVGNTGETDHPKPEQTDHLKGWRRLPNFAGEDFQFSADLV